MREDRMSCNDALPRPSSEQSAVVASVIEDMLHVRVDAVAGAGKTTTILHIAASLTGGAALLVLTYNAKLKSETRERCSRMAIGNVSVHTYHSAGLNLYDDPACSKDEGIAALVRDKARAPLPCYRQAFAVIVVDEAQDMTHMYFDLVRRLIMDVCVPDVRVVVLGDARQSVYGFKGADSRFLTLADRLPAYASDKRKWRTHALSTTYRLAPRLSRFVNSQLLDGVDELTSNHQVGGPTGTVRYLRCNTFGDMPFRQVKEWLASGLLETDIFVLAPSIRVNIKHSPVRMLENRLVHAGVRCYAASSDEERLDEDVTRGKIVFATFHQVKGLERRAVLVFNFDSSYHQYYERESSTGSVGSGCPNAIYVAATRAMQNLTVLHDSKHAPLRTVRMNHISRDADFVVDGSPYKGGSSKDSLTGNDNVSDISVTELLRHQKQDVLHAAMDCLVVKGFTGIKLDVEPGGEEQKVFWDDNNGDGDGDGDGDGGSGDNTLLRNKIETGENSWENVAAITGTAMPCMYEYQTSGRCTLLARAAHASKGLPPADRERIRKLHGFAERQRDREFEEVDRNGGRGFSTRRLSIAEFLYVANVHIALTGGFTHKLRQIKVYDWVHSDDVLKMLSVMRQHVTGPPGAVMYERPACISLMLQGRRTVRLSCAVDCLDMSTKIAFEIKCVAHVTDEHVLQTALNGLLLERGIGSVSRGCQAYRHVLLNLCDGGAREIIIGSGEGVLKAALILLEARFASEQNADDQTFLASLTSLPASTVCPSNTYGEQGAHISHMNRPSQGTQGTQGIQEYAFVSDDGE